MRLVGDFAPLLNLFLLTGLPASAVSQAAGSKFDPEIYAVLEWRNIGPTVGGRVVAVAGVPSDPLTYYHGGVGAGVWKTDDAGQSWHNVSDGFLGTSSVGAIAVAESDPNVIYVGMGEGPVKGAASSHGDGVYRSNDAGRTWVHLGLERTRQISRLAIHPTNPDVVYIAAQGAAYAPTAERGIYRTTDGGETWELVLKANETTGASDVSLDPDNPRVLYAAMWDHLRRPWEIRSGGPGSGIYRSTDAGDSWTRLDNGLPELVGKIGVAATPGSDRVYAMVEADPGGGLFRSEDRGDTWTLVNTDWRLRSRAWYYMHVIADPTDADHVWVLNNPLLKSIDGGRTFESVPVEHGDVHALWINPNDTRAMINGNDGGASVSLTGGGSWSTQANQPTGQFYRVNADNLHPYRVYGAQQDRGTARTTSMPPPGEGARFDFDDVGGCESAHIAFDPDSPRFVYAGCYLGQISVYDDETGLIRDVMAYPEVHAGIAPREIKYRFNWNAPILVSQHDPDVIYHAANQVLRSDDRGRSWTEISADLTTDDESKQGPGGYPITNEIVSLENYTTTLSLAESPRDARELWAGSDDGLVHLTRDGGATWENITPDGMGEVQVNAIDISAHAPGKAYIAATRYEFNDLTPYAYRTEDYGRTWESIVTGIPAQSWVHVVREDPERAGLLYAGTETGVMVSFDDGAHWQSLQQNLPVVPVTDLKVHHDDLVVSTQGRALWILEDVSPVRQMSEPVLASASHLFEPTPAIRTEPAGRAYIDFYLEAVPDSGVQIEISDSGGQVVREYQLSGEVELRQGINRVQWDLRHESLPDVPGIHTPRVPLGGALLAGRRVLPGQYDVRLYAGQAEHSRTLQVMMDPRSQATDADLHAQDMLMQAIDRELTEINSAATDIRSVRVQVASLIARGVGQEGIEELTGVAEVFTDSLTRVEGALIQTRATASVQTVINFTNRLNYHYVQLRLQVDAAAGAPTEGQQTRFADLSKQWAIEQVDVQRVLVDDLNGFNDLVRRHGLPAIVSGGTRRDIS